MASPVAAVGVVSASVITWQNESSPLAIGLVAMVTSIVSAVGHGVASAPASPDEQREAAASVGTTPSLPASASAPQDEVVPVASEVEVASVTGATIHNFNFKFNSTHKIYHCSSLTTNVVS